MPYTKQTWANGAVGATPLSAARLNHMEDGIEAAAAGGGGGGGGGGTVFVAASNAWDSSKAAAGEFVCDGTGDEEVINAALQSVMSYAEDRGGSVVLSEGRFHISNPIVFHDGDHFAYMIVVRGARYAGYWNTSTTRVYVDADCPAVAWHASNWTLSSAGGTIHLADFAIDQGSPGTTPAIVGRSVILEGIQLNGHGPAGVLCEDFEIQRSSLVATGPSLSSNGFYWGILRDSYIYSRDDYAMYAANPDGWENFLDVSGVFSDGNGLGAVHLDGVNQFSITGNQFTWDSAQAILIENCVDGIVASNRCYEGGLKIDGSTGILVDGNVFTEVDQHAIHLVDSSDCQVIGNRVLNVGLDTADTYSGIILDGNSDRNLVTGNTVRGADAKYGIRVDDATCNDNIVVNNDLRGTGATAAYSDAGTGTVTTAGNWS